MKNYLVALLIIFFGTTVLISCTKTDLTNSPSTSQNLNSGKKVKPNVLDCGSGYHWDFYLHICEVDCPSGYHNDSITGACTLTGNGNGGNNSNLSVTTNSNNPEENVGQTHNTGMSAVMPNYSNGTLEPTGANSFAFTKAYLYSENYDTTTINNSNNYVIQNMEQSINKQV